jgi:SAM-dependent methyltransferase
MTGLKVFICLKEYFLNGSNDTELLAERWLNVSDRDGRLIADKAFDALANSKMFNMLTSKKLVEMSPHLKHRHLQELFEQLVSEVYGAAASIGERPRILDLGAGEGSITQVFLQKGAEVTAVDISKTQLEFLGEKNRDFADRLEIRCQDVYGALHSLESAGEKYEIVVTNSFLHHLKDYLTLIERIPAVMTANSVFFSFQDPIKYTSLNRINRCFNWIAYYSSRMFQGDLLRGLGRYLRRRRGVYLNDCLEDNVEYHGTRGGVDQEAIISLLHKSGYKCRLISYFSTTSAFWQAIGEGLGMKSTFSIIAYRLADKNSDRGPDQPVQ